MVPGCATFAACDRAPDAWPISQYSAVGNSLAELGSIENTEVAWKCFEKIRALVAFEKAVLPAATELWKT